MALDGSTNPSQKFSQQTVLWAKYKSSQLADLTIIHHNVTHKELAVRYHLAVFLPSSRKNDDVGSQSTGLLLLYKATAILVLHKDTQL